MPRKTSLLGGPLCISGLSREPRMPSGVMLTLAKSSFTPVTILTFSLPLLEIGLKVGCGDSLSILAMDKR
jgi:hypothetical protein